MINLLSNAGFEGGAHRATHTGQAYGEIDVPEQWVAFWREGGGPLPHDPDNREGYKRPEMKVIQNLPPYTHPARVYEGQKAVLWFTFYGAQDAGLYQQVSATPGRIYRAGFYAHAWSSNGDDPAKSDVSTPDSRANFAFRAGIDPTGGTDPWADSVVWGDAAALYDTYGDVPPVDVIAQAEKITVFIRSTSLWRFKHSDAYVDDATLVMLGSEPPPVTPKPPDPEPPADHEGARFAQNTGSKLGIHGILPGSTLNAVASAAMAGGRLASVKAVADPGWLSEVKATDASIPTLARFLRGTDPNLDVEGPPLDGNLRTTAQRVMQSLLPLWEQHRDYIDYWEIINEQDPPGIEGQLKIAELMQYCMEIAEAEGYKLALFSYSRGVPEWEEWKAIVQTGIFANAKAGGHVLSLHEYADPMDQWFGEPLPGRPAYPNRGPLACRYRWLYEDFLKPRGEVIPLYITEANLHGRDIRNVPPDEWISNMAWYDAELRKDYYVIGAHLFTLGSNWWPHYNFEHLMPDIIRYIVNEIDAPNAPWPIGETPETPGYDRTVIVADNNFLTEDQRMLLYAEAFERSITVTPSWQDARHAPPDARTRTIEAPGVPEDRQQAHANYVAEIDPEAVVVFTPAPGEESPPEEPSPGELWLSPPTTHQPHVVTSPYGQDRGTYIHRGLDLRSSWAAWGDELLACVDGEVEIVGYEQGREYFGYQVQIRSGEALIRYAHLVEGGAYVEVGDVVTRGQPIGRPDNTGVSSGDHLHLDVRVNGQYVDPTPLIRWDNDPGPSTPTTLLGFNDYPGAGTASEWMKAEGVKGIIVRPIFLTGDSARLDFSQVEAAGLRVIVNLRYSWSVDLGGGGTIPAPDTPAWDRFVRAAAETIQQSVGVWGWELMNEANNPREWPANTQLTPQQIAYTYNTIEGLTGGYFRLAPGALDPFNAQAGDPRDWLSGIYGAINRADFVTAHGYIRGPDESLVGSGDKFVDAPLQWQYLNYPGCITALLGSLPDKYRGLDVYVTEFNHLWRDGGEGDWGWVRDSRGGQVVEAAYQAAREKGFAGLALYRWSGDEWALETNGYVLGAVKSLLS